jgi:hypothetical protein
MTYLESYCGRGLSLSAVHSISRLEQDDSVGACMMHLIDTSKVVNYWGYVLLDLAFVIS